MRLKILIWILAVTALMWAGQGFSSWSFNGTTAYLSVPGSGAVNVSGTTFSMGAWINATSSGSFGIISKDGVYQYRLEAGNGTSTVSGIVGNGASSHSTSLGNSGSLSSSTWHHLAFTLNGTAQVLYIDGSNAASNTGGITMGANSAPLYVGSNAGSGYFTGRIAEVGIWNVTLTPDEIRALASCTPPPVVHGGSSLVFYDPGWAIDSPEVDLSGNFQSITVGAATKANHVCGPGPGDF